MDEVTRMVAEAEASPRELLTARSELAELDRRQSRLAQLYTRSDMPPSVLEAESCALADRRWKLEARIRELEPSAPRGAAIEALRRDLPGILEKIRERISVGGETTSSYCYAPWMPRSRRQRRARPSPGRCQ